MIAAATIPLPPTYRQGDFFEFHGRDPQGIAERIDGSTLYKGLMLEGRPACLTLHFGDSRVAATLDIDGADTTKIAATALVRRMLGLDQPIEAFEQTHAGHPQLGSLIALNAGLRVPLAASPFEALTWAVTGQQISLSAAVALRRKLIQAAGVRHSGGLHCYPNAATISGMGLEALRRSGFSQTKAQTLLTLSQQVLDSHLPLDQWLKNQPPEAAIRTALLDIRGIGPWTVDYAMLRGFGMLDGSLHGDAGVRRGLQRLLAAPAPLTESQTRTWLAPFSPWRALVAAHLWTLSVNTP